MTTNEKLARLRAVMQERGLAATIVPSADPHQSEYVADHWKGRTWLSGFTGSAATVVVTAERAGVWTDSRYYLQAERQLAGSGFELFKYGLPGVPDHLDWLKEQLAEGSRLGLDGRIFSVGQVRRMAKLFYDKKIELETGHDLIGAIWQGRPAMPQSPVFEHEVRFAGATRPQKLESLRRKMGGADYHLISTLDDVAWLFNLRGSDVECNPVFYAYAVVGQEAAWLFVETAKLTADLVQRLNADGVVVRPYDSLTDFLKQIAEGEKMLLDMSTTSNAAHAALPAGCVAEGENYTAALKTLKNATEVELLRKTMARDGVALVKIFRWLEAELAAGRSVPETEVADRLHDFRAELEHYFGDSFPAIVGYNGNGASPHYRAEPGTCANIQPTGILLLDSGGQYLDGTTDITRTIALSEPTAQQQRDFTLVLKAVLALSMARFPKGTNGVQLDTVARTVIWQDALNFGHGTGHGVGFFLSVHEGPQGFSPLNSPRSHTAFEPGMVTSNEPALYRPGQYGIRTENLLLVVEDVENEFGKFYRFETLTLFPIDLRLVDVSMLSAAERQWMNWYHELVFEKISPFLTGAEVGWLREKCGKL